MSKTSDTALDRLTELVAEGAELFNQGAYWEAHEAWEEGWLALREAGRWPEADLLQGLILATAALENLSRGKPAGFTTQGAKALARMRAHPEAGQAIGLADLKAFQEAFTDLYLEAVSRKLSSLEALEGTVPRLEIEQADT